ncbi:hypothetical protein MMC11_005053 [Xylographa trunciseda]|nr:hypothetical protein [Xylographa trunciseda]
MAASSSAVAKTMVLPELLDAIVSYFMSDMTTLTACLRVNNSFHEAAARHLWERCGSGGGPNGGWPGVQWSGPDNFPEIRHLAALAENPARLQWYARYVTCMFFAIEAGDGGCETSISSRHESRYHNIFSRTSFPRLRLLKVDIPGDGALYSSGSSLLHYLQPALQYCQISGGSFTDEFISLMKIRCKSMRELKLGYTRGNTSFDEVATSEYGMINFIQSMPSLRLFDVRGVVDGIWSFKLLVAMAQQGNLHTLSLPDIPDAWTSDFVRFPHDGLFLKTRNLTTGLSDACLEILVPYLSRIQSLWLNVSGRSLRILTAAARCASLKYLNLHLEADDIVRGRDLLLLTNSCPLLRWLEVSAKGSEPCSHLDVGCENITDATIDHLARSCAELYHLSLCLAGSTLTEQSLLSLSRHCKGLSLLNITADVDLDALLRDDHRNCFPRLDDFELRPPPPSDRRHYANPVQTLKRLLEAAPGLRYLELGSGERFENRTPSEQELQDKFDSLVEVSRGTGTDVTARNIRIDLLPDV